MSEYLLSLQKQNKGSREREREKEMEIPNMGNFVLFFEKEAQRFNYSLEEIPEIFEGKNATASSALLETATGSNKRPIVILIPVQSYRK